MSLSKKRSIEEAARRRVHGRLADVHRQRDAILHVVDDLACRVRDISDKAEASAQALLAERERSKFLHHLTPVMTELEGAYNTLFLLQASLLGDDTETGSDLSDVESMKSKTCPSKNTTSDETAAVTTAATAAAAAATATATATATAAASTARDEQEQNADQKITASQKTVKVEGSAQSAAFAADVSLGLVDASTQSVLAPPSDLTLLSNVPRTNLEETAADEPSGLSRGGVLSSTAVPLPADLSGFTELIESSFVTCDLENPTQYFETIPRGSDGKTERGAVDRGTASPTEAAVQTANSNPEVALRPNCSGSSEVSSKNDLQGSQADIEKNNSGSLKDDVHDCGLLSAKSTATEITATESILESAPINNSSVKSKTKDVKRIVATLENSSRTSRAVEQLPSKSSGARASRDLDVEIAPLTFEEGVTLDVFVTEVLSPSMFWIQPQNSVLDDLMDQIEKYEEKMKPSSSWSRLRAAPRPGMCLLGRFTQDNFWYRVRVLAVYEVAPPQADKDGTDYEMDVLYIDYGNRERIAMERVQPIPPKFTKLPCHAFMCSLSEVGAPDGSSFVWPTPLILEFAGMVTQGTMFHAAFKQLPTCPMVFVTLFAPQSPHLPVRKASAQKGPVTSVMFDIGELFCGSGKARKMDNARISELYETHLSLYEQQQRPSSLCGMLSERELHRCQAPIFTPPAGSATVEDVAAAAAACAVGVWPGSDPPGWAGASWSAQPEADKGPDQAVKPPRTKPTGSVARFKAASRAASSETAGKLTESSRPTKSLRPSVGGSKSPPLAPGSPRSKSETRDITTGKRDEGRSASEAKEVGAKRSQAQEGPKEATDLGSVSTESKEPAKANRRGDALKDSKAALKAHSKMSSNSSEEWQREVVGESLDEILQKEAEKSLERRRGTGIDPDDVRQLDAPGQGQEQDSGGGGGGRGNGKATLTSTPVSAVKQELDFRTPESVDARRCGRELDVPPSEKVRRDSPPEQKPRETVSEPPDTPQQRLLEMGLPSMLPRGCEYSTLFNKWMKGNASTDVSVPSNPVPSEDPRSDGDDAPTGSHFRDLDLTSITVETELRPPKLILPDDKCLWFLMSYIESPSRFWVHLVTPEAMKTLQCLQKGLNDMYKKANRLILQKYFEGRELKLHSMCCVKFRQDEEYYRAEIVKIRYDEKQSAGQVVRPKIVSPQTSRKISKVKVHYVDFGNSEWTRVENIYPLPPQFTESPPQAVCCCVANVAPTAWRPTSCDNGAAEEKATSDSELQDVKWSVEACKEFVQLTGFEKQVIGYVVNVQEDYVCPSTECPVPLILVDTSLKTDVWINEELVRHGHGLKTGRLRHDFGAGKGPPSIKSLETSKPNEADCAFKPDRQGLYTLCMVNPGWKKKRIKKTFLAHGKVTDIRYIKTHVYIRFEKKDLALAVLQALKKKLGLYIATPNPEMDSAAAPSSVNTSSVAETGSEEGVAHQEEVGGGKPPGGDPPTQETSRLDEDTSQTLAATTPGGEGPSDAAATSGVDQSSDKDQRTLWVPHAEGLTQEEIVRMCAENGSVAEVEPADGWVLVTFKERKGAKAALSALKEKHGVEIRADTEAETSTKGSEAGPPAEQLQGETTGNTSPSPHSPYSGQETDPIVIQSEEEEFPVDWDPMSEDYMSLRNSYQVDMDDPGVALTTIKAQDDRQVCHFFNRHGQCWRGDNCRYLHTRVGDAVTQEKRLVYYANSPEVTIPLPQIGTWVAVELTSIFNPSHFYVAFPFGTKSVLELIREESGLTDEGYAGSSAPTMQESLEVLMEAINDHYTHVSGRNHDMTVYACGEIVVCRFTDDQRWYRARVVDTDPDRNKVEVFYVDYGNTEWINEQTIRQMEPQFMHLPFQAVECFLPLEPAADDAAWSKEAKEYFCELADGKVLFAQVLSRGHNGVIAVELYDTSGREELHVNQVLVDKAFAKRPPGGASVLRRGSVTSGHSSRSNSGSSSGVPRLLPG